MPHRSQKKTRALATQTAELALAVPQVVAHRVTRMALAGASPSRRDQAEFQRMVQEKQAAFSQAWMVMGLQSWRAGHEWALSVTRSMWAPLLGAGLPGQDLSQAHARLQADTLDVLHKGLAPLHRTAVANARRLARTPLR